MRSIEELACVAKNIGVLERAIRQVVRIDANGRIKLAVCGYGKYRLGTDQQRVLGDAVWLMVKTGAWRQKLGEPMPALRDTPARLSCLEDDDD